MKGYCINCRRIVEVKEEIKQKTEILFDVEISYNETLAICPICGEELYCGEANDKNLDALYDAYRRTKPIETKLTKFIKEHSN